MGFFARLLIGIALQFIGYLLAPKPPEQEKPEIKELDDPVAEAGMPVPVVFGTKIVKGTNTLWYGNKRIEKRDSGGGGK